MWPSTVKSRVRVRATLQRNPPDAGASVPCPATTSDREPHLYWQAVAA
jgi:hypothetical protein